MHYLDETSIFLFLLQVAILLGLSRLFGELLRRRGQPAITGEILVGVLLGPAIFGRIAPEWQAWLFPGEAVQWTMLDSLAWLGLLLFLLKTGLETDFSAAWRQKGDALIISTADLLIPMTIAFIPALFLPERYMATPGQPVMFAIFIATIMTISALPVTVRVLQDLGIYKTDMGFLTVSALTINDVAGWLIFAIVLGFLATGGMGAGNVAYVLGATVVFAGVCLTAGRWFTGSVISAIQRKRLPEPGSSVTFICLLGLLCGAITVKIGIHALFGFFIAGIMAGEARALSERTREVFSQIVHAILVPLFFAVIGLKIDFLEHFDPLLLGFMLVVGIVGRYAGAWLGVTLSKQPRSIRVPVSIGHLPGGEMQIVIGILALEYEVITPPVFVAIVTSAVLTCIIIGPLMRWALNREKKGSIARFLPVSIPFIELDDNDSTNAISTLCVAAAHHEPSLDAETVWRAVLAREADKTTAIENGVAVPHARLDQLEKPVMIFGRSAAGIEWNSPDGRPAQFVFLVLTPEEGADLQLNIFRALCIGMSQESVRSALLRASPTDEITSLLQQAIVRAESR